MSETSPPSQSNESQNARFEGFARTLPENCVEYMLFVIEADTEPKKILSGLEAVRKAGLRLCSQLTKDYIWQRDGFGLEIKVENGTFYDSYYTQPWPRIRAILTHIQACSIFMALPTMVTR